MRNNTPTTYASRPRHNTTLLPQSNEKRLTRRTCEITLLKNRLFSSYDFAPRPHNNAIIRIFSDASLPTHRATLMDFPTCYRGNSLRWQ